MDEPKASDNILLILFYRKSRVKRTIKVPAISAKMADIPADEYSWRKYGQKPIKGSPHPRYAPCTNGTGSDISQMMQNIL
jgi:hypothetical protein